MNKNEIVISQDLQTQIKSFGQMLDKVKVNFLQAVSINPALKECKPETLILGIAKLGQLGLSTDSLDGEAALIPYKDENGQRVAQIQIQWKGYRSKLLKDVKGVKDFFASPIKKGDVSKWNPLTGEMVFTNQFTNDDFETVAKRAELPTIGYIAVVIVDKEVYGQENFGLYMSNDQIASHATKYSKTAKTKEDWYGEKTVAKAVYRKYKHKYQFHSDEAKDIANQALAVDQAVITKVDEDGTAEVEYIDNPNRKQDEKARVANVIKA